MSSHKTYTFTNRTILITNQSLQKSMFSPALRKNKKLPLKEKLNFAVHNLTDKNEITGLIENIKGMSLKNK